MGGGQFFLFGNPNRRQHGMKMTMPRMRNFISPNGCWGGPSINLEKCRRNVNEADKKAVNKYMTKIGEVINGVVGALLTDDNTEAESPKNANKKDKPEQTTKEKEDQAHPTEQADLGPNISDSTSKLYPALPKSQDNDVEKRDSSVEINDISRAPTSSNEAEIVPEKGAVALEPRVQVARQAMPNMGFNDDGGWLTSLIKAKKGDIVEVLGALQTDKKQ